MFDSHCHLHDPRLLERCAELLERAHSVGVHRLLLAGVDRAGWSVQAALGRRHPELAVAFGLHPVHVAESSDDALTVELAALAAALTGRAAELPRPHAVGELGLDASAGRRPSLPRQERLFREQLALARAAELPLVLHIVRSHGEALRILRSDGVPARGGVVHSYSGAAEQVPDYLRLGLHISFSPAITRPQSSRLAAAVRAVPSQRLLVESDAPDQTPWARRPAENEPAFLVDVLAALATVRGESVRALAAATEYNAAELFGFPLPSR